MEKLRICFVTSEIAPFVKAGGLGDVSQALPAYLHDRGHDVRVFVPFYSRIDTGLSDFSAVPEVRDVPVTLGSSFYSFSLFRAPLPGSGLPIHFVHCPPLYGRPALYSQDPDEHRRFLLLSRAAIESCQRFQWAPDVFHCHDWQTGMIPLMLKSGYAWDKLFRNSRTIFTIHNIGYQGVFGADILPDLGEGARAFLDAEDLAGGRINFLKTGLLQSDVLTTVSPTYAKEIQTPDFGFGLDGILRMRSGALTGILNGVDYASWSPETDPHLPAHYTAKTLDDKRKNKSALLQGLGLDPDPAPPVFGIVSRLAYQKGLDLVEEAAPYILSRHDARLVILGSGEPKYEESFRALQARFPGRACFYSGYNERLARLIEAGGDMFLMPSRYEPCGLNQMYSLKYGTVPIVRKTGGLADTVTQFDPDTGTGNGFVFEHFTAEGLVWAMEMALRLYREPKTWRTIMKNGMKEDFSWTVQGELYEELYARR